MSWLAYSSQESVHEAESLEESEDQDLQEDSILHTGKLYSWNLNNLTT